MTQEPFHPGLDAEWEQAKTVDGAGNTVVDTRPGAEGHAGIARLNKGIKRQQKELRLQLAEAANVRLLTEADRTEESKNVAERLPELAGDTPTYEEIATAAYALWQQRGCRHNHDVEDWLEAERELIRSRVPPPSRR
jgi:hypothetical protein